MPRHNGRGSKLGPSKRGRHKKQKSKETRAWKKLDKKGALPLLAP